MTVTTTRARESSGFLPASKKEIRFVTVEPGRISLHGVALTDSEYAMLRAIAERMKHGGRICTGCCGEGQIGGLLPNGGGYEAEQCPFCKGSGAC